MTLRGYRPTDEVRYALTENGIWRQKAQRSCRTNPLSKRLALERLENSGNTTEPHLHLHAVDPVTRAGVLMSFDGRVPVRNRVRINEETHGASGLR